MDRTFGFWDDAEWRTGAEGKARRVKPGVRLLADGLSNRVGRLRGYGNAIVPQVAAEFVIAFHTPRRCRSASTEAGKRERRKFSL